MKIVIMAGGQGTRFWPMSDQKKPKQFLQINHASQTMLQETYDRFRKWLPKESIYVITTSDYKKLTMEQLPELPENQLIVEPAQRDTGPCVALTAHYFLNQKNDDDEVLVHVPSDQYIGDDHELINALYRAEEKAYDKKSIVTLGVKPTRPETGYGYIDAVPTDSEDTTYQVRAFIEKPNQTKAEQLLQAEYTFWNSGIFIWKPSTIAYYMKQYQPDLWHALQISQDLESDYKTFPKLSVDYAILEKAQHVFMIPVAFEWDDMGTWTAVERINKQDVDDNLFIGGYDIESMATHNSFVLSDRDALIIGAENLIIVSNENGLLICDKSKEQDIKNLIKVIKHRKSSGDNDGSGD
ncbi:mannose-1-phosphate guanylyltransferase [Tuberibacillus sp. Marseille-P3662]|uniref:mannose-1-phosphate guanylyltransferase n=1 Tax=Tuberibacillus sp. Marseille-P3662 TaxID=1965358 RepID=UPI000A1C9E8A|nr:sugar phosphate nucleotidyltransferase [Tuberibacillus sp. Marseille-P3662]